jgi:hypothetical protein
MSLSLSNHKTYRGWTICYDPTPIPDRQFDYSATGPNYDAEWGGDEDGWVSNGEQVWAGSYEDLLVEIDAWFEDNLP